MKNTRWTIKEIQILKKEYPNLSKDAQDFERMFKRSWDSIKTKASQLKISRFSDFCRFISKVNKNSSKFYNGTECHEWIACKDRDGYGLFRSNKQSAARAHRWIYEYYNGPIVENLLVDHICRNKVCVNILHLRVVTPQINAIENNIGPAAINANKSRCPRCMGRIYHNYYFKW